MVHEIYNQKNGLVTETHDILAFLQFCKKHQTASAKRNQDENSGDSEFESVISKNIRFRIEPDVLEF